MNLTPRLGQDLVLEQVVRCPECGSKDTGYVQLECRDDRIYCRTCTFSGYGADGTKYFLDGRVEAPRGRSYPRKSALKRQWVKDE